MSLISEEPAVPIASFEKGYFKKDWCDKVISIGMKHPGNTAQTYGEGSRETIVYPIGPAHRWIYEGLEEFVRDINKEFRFQIRLKSLGPLQLLEYNEDGHYDWHIDIGPGEAAYRKLSIIVQLSEPSDYEGGEVVFKAGRDQTLGKTKGTICVFPSYILHKVRPVTSGTRYALVAWVTGDKKFR